MPSNIQNQNLTYQQIEDKIFDNHSFVNSDLSYAKFVKCKFFNCDFSRAEMVETSFEQCNFIEQGELEGCDFHYANLQEASFKNCQLPMSQFVGCNCFGIEFRQCDLKGVNFSQARFANQISHNVYFCSAYITGCNLSYANMERLCIEKCELFENRWIGTNLQGTSLQGSDLSNGEFSADIWGDFRIRDCDLSDCDLAGLNPARVDMHGVKIASWQQAQLLEQLGIIVM